MITPRIKPVQTFDNLRGRVGRLLSESKPSDSSGQMFLDLDCNQLPESSIKLPQKSVSEFLDFVSAIIPGGELYLFGGVLRDLAIFGKKGFWSDIDLVVEGDWYNCSSYLETLGARKNKFGGYRLNVANCPIDLWNAEETWAIKEGLVKYKDVSSLTETTVLNWDSILMSWRSKRFICREGYLDDIHSGMLDVVLHENPNPLGMIVRILRHLYMKDAKKITLDAADFISQRIRDYSFKDIVDSELSSYGYIVIGPAIYDFFSLVGRNGIKDVRKRFENAEYILKREFMSFSGVQQEWDFEHGYK